MIEKPSYEPPSAGMLLHCCRNPLHTIEMFLDHRTGIFKPRVVDVIGKPVKIEEALRG